MSSLAAPRIIPAMNMNANTDAFVTLLQNLGGRKEIERYLRAFTGTPADRIIIVKIGGGVIEERLDDCVSAIAALWAIGLRPVLAHGAGPQLTDALVAAGLEQTWVDGLRVTTAEAMPLVRRVCREVGTRLARAHETLGVRCRPLPSDAIHAEPLDSALGFVGEATGVDAALITDAIDAGCMPIVSSLGVSTGGQLLNVNADAVTAALAAGLGAKKVVFLTPTGGLLDERGRVLPAIDLSDINGDEPWITGGMLRKFTEIRGMLSRMPREASVSITSPEHLLRELFTHAGEGTFVRVGSPVRVIRDAADADWAALRTLLESSFGGELAPGYPSDAAIRRLIVGGDYDAAAIVTSLGPAAYLDKFAVTAEAQGQGVGAKVWRRLIELEPRVFWRSRAGNRINPWYFERADGFIRRPDWCVFWCGDFSPAEIETGVRATLDAPVTIVRTHKPDAE